MKRIQIFLVMSVGFLLAAESFGAMGPGLALPKSWSLSPGRGYPAFTGLSGNPASAMCVECHYANPSRTQPMASTPYSEPETSYRGSHYVINDFAVPGTPAKVSNTSLEKITGWANGAFSKYATFPNGLAPTNNAQGVVGEMICESCHSLKNNYGSSLLLEQYDTTTGVSLLCEGCHTGPASGPPNHHPMTGDNVGKESTCPGPSQPTCSNLPHELNIDHTLHLVDKSAIETAKPNTLGVGYVQSGSEPLSCQSCHTPHRALTWTGARIMRRGNMLVDSANKPVNVVYGPFETYARGDVVPRSTAANGLTRQVDLTGGKRLVVNADPLCMVCHK